MIYASQIIATYSPVKYKGVFFSIPINSTPNHHAQLISATSVNFSNLHTTTKLPLVGKEYMCFQNYGRTSQAEKCIK